jgi:hemerythrin
MPILQWNQSVSVNDADIDGQHKKLIDMINNLHDSMGQGKGKETLGSVLDGLIDYTKIHFTFEENRMKKENYIGYLAHKGEHDRFTKKVVDLQNQFHGGKFSLTIEVSTFLKDWLVNHIQVIDKKAFGK